MKTSCSGPSIGLSKTQSLKPQRFRITEKLREVPKPTNPFKLILQSQNERENHVPGAKKAGSRSLAGLKGCDDPPLPAKAVADGERSIEAAKQSKQLLPPIQINAFNFENVLLHRSKATAKLNSLVGKLESVAPSSEADEEHLRFNLTASEGDPYAIYHAIQLKNLKRLQQCAWVSHSPLGMTSIALLTKAQGKGRTTLFLDFNAFETPLLVDAPRSANVSTDSALAPGLGWSCSLPRIRNQSKYVDVATRLSSFNFHDNPQNEYFLSLHQAINYEEHQNYFRATERYTHYLRFAEKADDLAGPCFALNRISNCFFKLGKLDLSLKFAMKALPLIEEENLFVPLYNIGLFYRRLEFFDKAKDYFGRGLVWASKQGDLKLRLIFNIQLAITELSRHNFPKVTQILGVASTELP